LSTVRPAGAAVVDPQFFDRAIVNALSSATAMAFSPDGRLFVAQQGGSLRVIRNGRLLPTPFVTLTVNSTGERGLLGVAFDPDFATNQWVYVYYTATTPSIHNRVSRFTAQGDVAAPGSELVLMDLETLSATNHNGGAIHFGPDGKLYIAVGENAVTSNSQTLANKLGKVLRINKDGSIPSDNPFHDGAGPNADAIWALGLRNPFTFAFDPAGRMFVNDVGAGTWDRPISRATTSSRICAAAGSAASIRRRRVRRPRSPRGCRARWTSPSVPKATCTMRSAEGAA
jgi:glucose/arabinose dehydrogenase